MIARTPVEGQEASPVDYDTIIIGAGISGINAAYRIQEQCPGRTYAIFEARDAIGGTWDLFKYPGIRSDSDLHTFGFAWRPWKSENTIADAPSILKYMKECVQWAGIDKKINFGHRLINANWSSSAQAWSLKLEANGEQKSVTARFMTLATGYYDYKEALPAHITGIDKFEGQVIHPQFWPENLDYNGKNIVIIGSGATAITLLPNLTEKASHVTLLQRSPTYILSLPKEDASANFMKRWLPLRLAYALIRLKFIVLPFLFFKFCRAFPKPARSILQAGAQKQLPKSVSVKPHFSPKYGPWEQRLCVCPSGDFYRALRQDKASVVTGHIQEVTEKSIKIKDSGEVLHPDIIITATGLKVQLAGGAKISVDNKPVEINSKHVWKGAMLEDVPNAAIMIGYTNASWTLGADATAQLINRITNRMDKEGRTSITPFVEKDSNLQDRSVLNLNSTYVIKAQGEMPKAGNQAPWLPRSTYIFDIWDAWYGNITKGAKYV